MNIVQEFTEVFESITQEQHALLLEAWWPPSKFTKYFGEQMIPAIANGLECKVVREYPFGSRRIDFVFERQSPATHEQGRNPSHHVAIEHENNREFSSEEMEKLRDFNAPLNALITYDSLKYRTKKLAEFTAILSDRTSNSQNTRHPVILLIFGPYGKRPPENLEWHYYLNEGEGFKRYHA